MSDRDAAADPIPVTVVVVSYFSADELTACLDSVVDQAGVDPRVIVVDNAPVDGESEATRLCREYDAVTHVDNDRNVGFGTAVNQGFARAETDYLCTINPDAVARPGGLRALLEPIERGAASFTTGKVLERDDEGTISTCGLANHVSGISFRQGEGLPSDHPEWSRPRDVGGLSGCLFATTAAAWERVGGFDEAMFLYKDDVSVSWACQLLGEPIRFVPDAAVLHDSDADLDGFKLYNIERNRLLMLGKYLPPSGLLLAPTLLLAELLTWTMAARLGVEGLRAKLRTYGVLRSAEFREVRIENERFQERFPEGVTGLRTAVPWAELARSGTVPDSRAVTAAGACLNALFRTNTAVYRALTR